MPDLFQPDECPGIYILLHDTLRLPAKKAAVSRYEKSSVLSRYAVTEHSAEPQKTRPRAPGIRFSEDSADHDGREAAESGPAEAAERPSAYVSRYPSARASLMPCHGFTAAAGGHPAPPEQAVVPPKTCLPLRNAGRFFQSAPFFRRGNVPLPRPDAPSPARHAPAFTANLPFRYGQPPGPVLSSAISLREEPWIPVMMMNTILM